MASTELLTSLNRLTAHQKRLIEEVAQLKAQGLNPMALRQQGRVNDATVLSMNIGYLDELNLLPAVDQRAQEIQTAASAPETTSPPVQQSIEQSSAEQTVLQPSLFALPVIDQLALDTAHLTKPRKKKSNGRRKAKQYTLEDLHKDSKHTPTPRQNLQTAEAWRQRQRHLEAVGWKQPTKKSLGESAEVAIARLKAAGVWKYIANFKPTDAATRELVTQKLEEYDKAQRALARQNKRRS